MRQIWWKKLSGLSHVGTKQWIVEYFNTIPTSDSKKNCVSDLSLEQQTMKQYMPLPPWLKLAPKFDLASQPLHPTNVTVHYDVGWLKYIVKARAPAFGFKIVWNDFQAANKQIKLQKLWESRHLDDLNNLRIQ